eukprot:snap_masked-scaffold_34-processed-gene-0.48-mRNA-1 protein AED:1.00 eAED:1.00 QI:0/0/0/0/1/1/2/0/88
MRSFLLADFNWRKILLVSGSLETVLKYQFLLKSGNINWITPLIFTSLPELYHHTSLLKSQKYFIHIFFLAARLRKQNFVAKLQSLTMS